MALWHTPHSFLWAQNGRWWTSFFRYIVTSVNVSSVTAATGPCAETTSNKNDAPIYFSGDHTPVFWSHRWKNKAVGLRVNSWRIHSHINHNCCGLSVLVCMLWNFNTLTTEWKDNTCLKIVIIFLWFWLMREIALHLLTICWLIITCCCHLVVKCRNTKEGSSWYLKFYWSLFFSPSLHASKPSKQSKSASPPQKPLTLAYDGDVDMWSSSLWHSYVHSKHKLDYVQHFNMFISPRHTLDFGKKKKTQGVTDRHEICSVHKTLYAQQQGQRFWISGCRHENRDI